jgi:hypothetical protein
MTAIQSKTNADANEVFKKLIRSWQRLPEYYKPVDTGETRPTQSLRFDEPSKRSTKTQAKEYAEVLRTEISYFNAKEEALDGLGLLFVLQDEVGKTVDSDVATRWRITRECLADGANITGKALLTTTVEEMDKKGGKNCKEIWDDSDPNELNALGQTKSGLLRYFKPAYYGLRGADEKGVSFIDDYGYSDIERTKDYLNKRREKLTGRAYADECRKYPMNISEAFYMDSKHEAFPSFKIYQQIEYNESLMSLNIRRGNFIWEEGEESVVGFRDDPKGRFTISWMPPTEKRNKKIMKHGQWHPLQDISGIFGVDPFDHKTTSDSRKSNAGCHGFLGFNPLEPFMSNMFVLEYLCRPDDPDDFYEDMLKAAVFYGWKLLVENQKPGLINYLRRKGYAGYIATTNNRDTTKSSSSKVVEGISTSGDIVRGALIENLYKYVYDFIGKIDPDIQMKCGFSHADVIDTLHGNMPFGRTLQDWLNFNPSKWTDYDATVSSMIACTGMTGVWRNKATKKEEDRKPITIFKKW